eukprot:403331694
MRNRKNTPKKTETPSRMPSSLKNKKSSSLNRSQSFKSLRNEDKKPVSTFGCSFRVFNWEMYSTEQQEATSLKKLPKPKANFNQGSRNQPIKAFTNGYQSAATLPSTQSDNLKLDYNITVQPRGGPSEQAHGEMTQRVSFSPNTIDNAQERKVSGDQQQLQTHQSYHEPQLNRLNTKDTQKLYGQGQFNPFSGETYDERYRNRYGFQAEPKPQENLKSLNTRDMKKLYGQGEFNPLTGVTYDERFKQRYIPVKEQTAAGKPLNQNHRQSMQLTKNNSNRMSEVLNYKSAKGVGQTQGTVQNGSRMRQTLELKQEISEKPNRIQFVQATAIPKISNLEYISSLRTDPSMINVN